MGMQYAREFGLNFLALRLTTTYGPGKGTDRHGHHGFVSRVIEGAFYGQSVNYERGREQKNDFVYCKDIAQAVAKAVLASKVPSGSYNIGSGRLASVEELIKAIKKRLPNSQIHIGPGLDYYGTGIHHYIWYDISRAKEEFGYEPRYDLDAGVADYLSFLERQQNPVD